MGERNQWIWREECVLADLLSTSVFQPSSSFFDVCSMKSTWFLLWKASFSLNFPWPQFSSFPPLSSIFHSLSLSTFFYLYLSSLSLSHLFLSHPKFVLFFLSPSLFLLTPLISIHLASSFNFRAESGKLFMNLIGVNLLCCQCHIKLRIYKNRQIVRWSYSFECLFTTTSNIMCGWGFMFIWYLL